MTKNQSALLILTLFLIFSCKKTDLQNESASSKINSTNSFYTNAREAGGASGGVTFECTSCKMTYPDSSNLPRSLAAFHENEVLVAADPGQTTCGTQPTEIKVWYADEHPLCIGVRQIITKTSSGSKTVNYPISASTLNGASIVINPFIGASDQSGDNTGNDVAVDGGRPLWPALFITDITNKLSSRAGDWQQGGIAYPPSKICGMWKAAVKIIDKTRVPNLVTIQMDADPKKSNGWDLAGGAAPPKGTIVNKYGAMVSWNISALPLLPGHIYRIQFMVHDGDQNKTGGDVGQSCTTIIIP